MCVHSCKIFPEWIQRISPSAAASTKTNLVTQPTREKKPRIFYYISPIPVAHIPFSYFSYYTDIIGILLCVCIWLSRFITPNYIIKCTLLIYICQNSKSIYR